MSTRTLGDAVAKFLQVTLHWLQTDAVVGWLTVASPITVWLHSRLFFAINYLSLQLRFQHKMTFGSYCFILRYFWELHAGITCDRCMRTKGHPTSCVTERSLVMCWCMSWLYWGVITGITRDSIGAELVGTELHLLQYHIIKSPGKCKRSYWVILSSVNNHSERIWGLLYRYYILYFFSS